MKITYASPNRSHHYPYAQALHKAGHLHAFISGFSRLSPRSDFPEIGDKIKRHDFFQTLFLFCSKYNLPQYLTFLALRLSNERLDNVSYSWAKQSDVFIYYRTQGLRSTTKLHKEGAATICVMEEVNSHVEFAHEIMEQEFNRLGLKSKFQREPDYDLRLQTYEETDYILCPSEFVKNSFLMKGFSPEKLLKVNFGFPAIETNIRARETDDGTFRILYVGQIHYRKGLRYAIEAFKKLRHPNKEFVIVGPETLVTGLEKTQIPSKVVFTGPLKGEELKEHYRRANVFVLPSLEEGLALVQAEALSFGIPLLITSNTGGADLITDGKEGFIVPPAEIDLLSLKLQEMADDKLLLNQMSANALQTAARLGSWDVAADNLVNLLSGILSHPKQKFN